ncbi:MAG: DUF3737 family protein [Clostridiales bacterium]|nr:DUF3737 family protein [Clostridiales bacterium]
MTVIENQAFDTERALYGSDSVKALTCRFDGPADGESAFKESSDITAQNCFFNLRYPFWHGKHITVTGSEMTELCRAAFWYTEDISIDNTAMHGIKALRECSDVKINNCDIVSPEFGWFTKNVEMKDCSAVGEYFMFRASGLNFDNVTLSGKYSFQYIEDCVFTNCRFDTKDAFWHAKNVLVKDSVVNGEYLAWYCENVTFENCTVTGTQPLCYCKGLKMINCRMEKADLSFEKSDVQAQIISGVDSIKNPKSGSITVMSVNEIIMDDKDAECKIIISGN